MAGDGREDLRREVMPPAGLQPLPDERRVDLDAGLPFRRQPEAQGVGRQLRLSDQPPQDLAHPIAIEPAHRFRCPLETLAPDTSTR